MRKQHRNKHYPKRNFRRDHIQMQQRDELFRTQEQPRVNPGFF